MAEHPDDLSLVQIGSFVDVPPDGLEGPGDRLWELTADLDVQLQNEFAHEEWEQLVDTPGWRFLPPETSAALERRLLAAPDPSEPGSWQVIFLVHRDGKWHFNRHRTQQKVRPGRPYRRRHLRLTWAEEEFTATQGEGPVLTAVLTNTGPEVWNETGQDQLRVVAWLYQGEEELPATHWVAYAPLADPRPALAPGEAVRVDAQFLTKDAESVAPGVYEVKGFLAPLNLRSSVGRLRVR